MSCFWAEWDTGIYPGHVIRKDTRVYYHSGGHAQSAGRCIGTFYLENPGSGQPSHGLSHHGWSTIVDLKGKPGDPTLQTIWDVWHCAQSLGKYIAQPDDYIEVLNLYYLRNAASGASLGLWMSHSSYPLYQPPINHASQFVVAGWGTPLNPHGLEPVMNLR